MKYTTEQFIKKAKLVHGDKYDYSLVDYKNSRTKVKIICNKCNNIFEQQPNNHLFGQDCPVCFGVFKKTTEQFIKEAKLIHGDKYDYSLVNYVNNKTKVKLICNKCNNIFEQKPNNHLNNQGCPVCFGVFKKTTEQFIKEAKLIHRDKYNYSLVDYRGNKTKVKIICNKCNNIFEQRPNDHLSGKGCKFCNNSKGEKVIELFLQKNNIFFEEQKKFEDLKDTSFLSYDFYIPSKNLLIEYNGIQHYNKKSFNKTKYDFLLQKHHDWLKRRYAKENNIKLITIPYWEFNNIENILKEKILNCSEEEDLGRRNI